MSSSINRYSYRPTDFPQFKQLSAAENRAQRSHPGNEIKDRSGEEMFPARLASTRIKRRSASEQNEQFVLDADRPIKGVGYSTNPSSTASTGTSKPGTLCLTDGMHLCVGVAVGGEKPAESKGKARIFHVMPENRQAQWEIKRYIDALRSQGYTAKAAIHGGDSTSRASMSKIGAIEATLEAMQVPVEFKRTGEGAVNGNGPLGAVVGQDGRVGFITKLAK